MSRCFHLTLGLLMVAVSLSPLLPADSTVTITVSSPSPMAQLVSVDKGTLTGGGTDKYGCNSQAQYLYYTVQSASYTWKAPPTGALPLFLPLSLSLSLSPLLSTMS